MGECSGFNVRNVASGADGQSVPSVNFIRLLSSSHRRIWSVTVGGRTGVWGRAHNKEICRARCSQTLSFGQVAIKKLRSTENAARTSTLDSDATEMTTTCHSKPSLTARRAGLGSSFSKLWRKRLWSVSPFYLQIERGRRPCGESGASGGGPRRSREEPGR